MTRARICPRSKNGGSTKRGRFGQPASVENMHGGQRVFGVRLPESSLRSRINHEGDMIPLRK